MLDAVTHQELIIAREYGRNFTLGSVGSELKRDWMRRAGTARRIQIWYGEDLVQGNDNCVWKELAEERVIEERSWEGPGMCQRRRGKSLE